MPPVEQTIKQNKTKQKQLNSYSKISECRWSSFLWNYRTSGVRSSVVGCQILRKWTSGFPKLGNFVKKNSHLPDRITIYKIHQERRQDTESSITSWICLNLLPRRGALLSSPSVSCKSTSCLLVLLSVSSFYFFLFSPPSISAFACVVKNA